MHHKPTAGVERQLLKLAPRVRAYARVLTCDAAAAEAALTEAYRDYLADGPMPGTEHTEQWILRRARQHALSRRRRLAQQHADPIAQEIRATDEALIGIAPRPREMLYLRVVENLGNEQIARWTDCRVTDVPPTVADGQAQFQARMGLSQPEAAGAALRRFVEAHAALPAPNLDLTPPRRSALRVFTIVFGAVALMAVTTYYIDQRAMSRHQTPTTAPSRH